MSGVEPVVDPDGLGDDSLEVWMTLLEAKRAQAAEDRRRVRLRGRERRVPDYLIRVDDLVALLDATDALPAFREHMREVIAAGRGRRGGRRGRG